MLQKYQSITAKHWCPKIFTVFTKGALQGIALRGISAGGAIFEIFGNEHHGQPLSIAKSFEPVTLY
jgi:hypothetical protein